MDGISLNVLIVEDNVDDAAILATLLDLLGHKPVTAHTGKEALELASQVQPDIVLLDIGLPDINGYEVAQSLREQSLDKPPFLVAVTGYGQEEDRQRSASAGINLHLVKPADSEFLTKLLKRFQGFVP